VDTGKEGRDRNRKVVNQ